MNRNNKSDFDPRFKRAQVLAQIIRAEEKQTKTVADARGKTKLETLWSLVLIGAIILGVVAALCATVFKKVCENVINTCTNSTGASNNCSKEADSCTSSSNKLSGD